MSCFGFLLIVVTALTVHAETITMVADEWPPFNAKPQGKAEGYMVDIARAVFEPKGILSHEAFVVPAFPNQHMSNTEGKGSVGFGSHRMRSPS